METNPEFVASLHRRRQYKKLLKIYVQKSRVESCARELANVASCLYKLGRIRFAETFAVKALLKDLENEPATLLMANIYFDKGFFRDAWTLFRRLLSSDQKQHAFWGLALVCLRQGKKRSAEGILESAIHQYPEEAWPYFNKSRYLTLDKRYRSAWSLLQQSLARDPLFIEAWEFAYDCSLNMEENATAKLIAEKLISFDHSVARFYEYLGIALYKLGAHPAEVTSVYRQALSLEPDNLTYLINSSAPCFKIANQGSSAYVMKQRLKELSAEINRSLLSGVKFAAKGSHPLTNAAFYLAYSSYNLRKVYQDYFAAIGRGFQTLIRKALQEGDEMIRLLNLNLPRHRSSGLSGNSTHRKIRIGFASQHFYGHSNTQAFSGFIKYLDRSSFEVVLIHKPFTKPDSVQLWLNDMADECIYLGDSLPFAYSMLKSLDLDILFFTDLGMDPWDFVLADMRTCSIQITGWGLPHTSGLTSIDYYLSSSMLESTYHQEEYTEELVLLDGLPCCFLAELLHYRVLGREYFMLPTHLLLIGCVQTLGKIHPDLDLAIEKIAQKVDGAYFVFVSSDSELITEQFVDRLSRRAPTAFSRLIMLSRCYANDFLSLCDCLDILLDTPYYGAGITSYMSVYVGTPIVCFKGVRLRDSTTAAIYKFLEINNAPIASSIKEYIDIAVRLAKNFDLRLQIKKDTVAAASKLYDQQDYVRSFEKFCLDIIRQSDAEADNAGT
jgi:protein O-GlcNAc transferase